jgi:hypothetical protein
MSLPQGIFLNAFPVVCSGPHRLTRILRPDRREERDALEHELGLRFWGTADFLYASGEVEVAGAEVVDVACEDDAALHLYALKEALRAHASERAADVWFGRGGVLHVVGLVEPTRHGRALSEVELRMRVTTEGVIAPELLLVARVRHRWTFADTLDDVRLQPSSIGGTAIRIAGAGPARGKIRRFDDAALVIESQAVEQTVNPADYRLRADAALVRQILDADTLFALQVAAGSLATNRRHNQSAIKDRLLALEKAMDELGHEFALPGGGTAQIERDPVAVRVQEGA